MATYLIPSWVLDLVEGNHITVVGKSHIEACKYLSFIAVQIGGVSQLMRDMGKKRRRLSSLMMRGRRLMRGWHCVVNK